MLTLLKMYVMSAAETFTALQACMIYLVIFIIDYSPDDEANARDLLMAMLVGLVVPIPPQQLISVRISIRYSKRWSMDVPSRARVLHRS